MDNYQSAIITCALSVLSHWVDLEQSAVFCQEHLIQLHYDACCLRRQKQHEAHQSQCQISCENIPKVYNVSVKAIVCSIIALVNITNSDNDFVKNYLKMT